MTLSATIQAEPVCDGDLFFGDSGITFSSFSFGPTCDGRHCVGSWIEASTVGDVVSALQYSYFAATVSAGV